MVNKGNRLPAVLSSRLGERTSQPAGANSQAAHYAHKPDAQARLRALPMLSTFNMRPNPTRPSLARRVNVNGPGLARETQPGVIRRTADHLEVELVIAVEFHLSDERSPFLFLEGQNVVVERILTLQLCRLLPGRPESPGEGVLVRQNQVKLLTVLAGRFPRSDHEVRINRRPERCGILGR